MSTNESIKTLLQDAAGENSCEHWHTRPARDRLFFDDQNDVGCNGEAIIHPGFVELRIECSPERAAEIIGLVTGTRKLVSTETVIEPLSEVPAASHIEAVKKAFDLSPELDELQALIAEQAADMASDANTPNVTP